MLKNGIVWHGDRKTLINEANNLIKNNDSRFAVELYKFAKEYIISLDFYKSAEYANFSFLRNLSESEKDKALEALKDKLLEFVEPFLQSKLDDFKRTLHISSANILLELEKMAMTNLNSQENIIGDINNPRLIIGANEKLKALTLLARYLGLFEKDNMQRSGHISIDIDNSKNKQEIQNMQVNNNLSVKFIDDKVSKSNIIDTTIKAVKK